MSKRAAPAGSEQIILEMWDDCVKLSARAFLAKYKPITGEMELWKWAETSWQVVKRRTADAHSQNQK